MACAVPSRFAILTIVEDDFITVKPTNKGKKVETPKNQGNKKQDDKKAKHPPPKPNKPTNKQNNPSTSNNASSKKKNPGQTEQWEEWKQKDNQMVDGNFEEDLQQAILLSKLDFEEKKKQYKNSKKEAEATKKLEEQRAQAQSGKKQKKKAMSLGQFNDLVNADSLESPKDEAQDTFENCPEPPTDDTHFFERIKSDAKDEVKKNKLNESRKKREPPSDDLIKGSQLIPVLEKKDQEIKTLREEVATLKAELLKVKSRNKQLCSIIGQGEMKDKAEALEEVDRLREVQNELTNEVASLHAQLEQERSRGGSSDLKTKDKKKKTAEKET